MRTSRLSTLSKLCVLTLLASLSMSAAASDGFRCHDTGRLIQMGDPRYSVVAKCREPDSISQRIEKRRIRGGSIFKNGRFVAEEREEEIVIEDWIYDFGKNRLVVHATFEHDKLVSVQFGGYGEK